MLLNHRHHRDMPPDDTLLSTEGALGNDSSIIADRGVAVFLPDPPVHFTN